MTTRAEQEPKCWCLHIGPCLCGYETRLRLYSLNTTQGLFETPEQTREWEIAQRWQPHTAKPVDYLPPPDDRL